MLRLLLIMLTHTVLVAFFFPGLNLNSLWLGPSFNSVIVRFQVEILTLCRATQVDSRANNAV